MTSFDSVCIAVKDAWLSAGDFEGNMKAAYYHTQRGNANEALRELTFGEKTLKDALLSFDLALKAVMRVVVTGVEDFSVTPFEVEVTS